MDCRFGNLPKHLPSKVRQCFAWSPQKTTNFFSGEDSFLELYLWVGGKQSWQSCWKFSAKIRENLIRSPERTTISDFSIEKIRFWTFFWRSRKQICQTCIAISVKRQISFCLRTWKLYQKLSLIQKLIVRRILWTRGTRTWLPRRKPYNYIQSDLVLTAENWNFFKRMFSLQNFP